MFLLMDFYCELKRTNTNLSIFSVCCAYVFHLWLFFYHLSSLFFFSFFYLFFWLFFYHFAKKYLTDDVNNQSNANFLFSRWTTNTSIKTHTHKLRIHYSFNYSFLVVETHCHGINVFYLYMIYNVRIEWNILVLLNSMCVCIYSQFWPALSRK